MSHPPPGRRVSSRRRRRLVVEALEHRLQPSSRLPELPTPAELTATVAGPLPLTVVDVPAFPGAAVGTSRAVVAPVAGESTSVMLGPPRRELYLVAFDVPDRDALVRDLLARPGFSAGVVELVGGGLTEVTAILQEWSDLDAVHLITHGAAGAITLGPDVLDAATLPLYGSDLRSWGAALAPDGDLLLYGCDVAADGGAFVTLLSARTGADVAASSDRTGAAELGGNWLLETATGSIETASYTGPADWVDSLAASDGLFLSTSGTVSSGITWQKDEVISFANPNLGLEPAGGGTTSGTFTSVLDLSRFGTKGAGVSAIHVVGSTVTVGVGSAAMTLLPGDVLLCVDNDDTFTGSDGVAVQVTKDEVFRFRPAAAGDATGGTFSMVLDDFRNWSGADETWSLALVEHDTRIGEALVPGGTFLFSRKGGSEHNDVRMFTPTGVGAGATSGPAPVVLIEGDQLNYTNKIFGLELVEADTTAGGRLLTAGTLLLALEADDNTVGTNNLAVTRNDVFALAVTRTSLNGQTAVATASLVFDGSDVGLSGSSARLTGLALPAGKTAANRPPVAADDQYTTAVNLIVLTPPLAIPGAAVLANDADPDGDALTAELVTGPAHGLLSFDADGSFTYTAVLNFSGTDSFTYRVTDGTAWSAPATVVISIFAPNRPPTAQPESFTTVEDTPLTVAGPGLLGNDTDPDGDTLAAFVDTFPLHGALTPRAGGGFTYTPAADWSGTDTFTYHATDGSRDSAPVVVTLTVAAVEDPPTLDPLPDLTVEEDSGVVTVPLSGVCAGGGENQPLTVTATSSNPTVVPNPSVVYASPSATGTVTFSPAADAVGTATITVTVDDGVTTTTRTFTVTVSPVNDPPAADDDAAGTAEDAAVTVGLLSNDTDADGDTLTVTGTGPAGHGTATTDGTTVTYTPAADWSGTDTFTYTVSDGKGGTATATVTVVVAPVNDAPVAADDGFVTQQNTALAVPATGVLGNDSDVEGDALDAVLVTGPAHGTLALNPDGSFLYTPNPAYTGTDCFTYRAFDGQAESQPATVELRVLPPPARPVAADDVYAVLAGQVLTVPADGVLANDTRSGTAALTAVLVSGPADGTLTFNPDGSFTYVPFAGFVGDDSFNYKAVDGGGETGTAHVTIRVLGPNRAPAGGADAIATVTGQSVVLTAAAALANDSDPDGDPLTAELVGGAANGTVTIAADGSFTYTPGAGFSGTDTFTYRVTDGQLVSELVQVTVTVSAPPTPEPPPTPADPLTPNTLPPTSTQPPASVPGPTVSTPSAPTAPPVANDTPTVSFAPSASVSFDGPGPAGSEPAGAVSPVPAVVSGSSIPSPRTNTPTVSDAGRVYSSGDAPAAAPVPPEVARPPTPAAPQPTPSAPTPSAPSPPPVAVVPPSVPVVAAAPVAPPPTANVVLPDTLFEPLDRIRDELRAESAERATTDSIVVVGGVAVAGTVLLNTRTVYWFLSALLARPAVWRRFDPLDVIYAWERDKSRGAGPDDSLQSMVG